MENISTKRFNKDTLLFVILIFLLISSMFIGLMVGTVPISFYDKIKILCNLITFQDTYGVDKNNVFIILEIRLPRVLLAGMVGFALSLCGAIMQCIFRNPLADPYLLGVASGSTAGISIIIVLNLLWIPFILPCSAFLGGITAVFIVYKISLSPFGKTSSYTLILAGVAIGSLFSSISSFLLFISKNEQMRQIIFWVMGSLAVAEWTSLFYLLIIIIFSSILCMFFANYLNAFSLGEEMAIHLGVAPQKLKKILLCITTFLTSAVVCCSGTIGFVGLIVPHATRILIGANHKRLLPACAIAGASFLILCDTCARTLIKPTELPVGVITAMFGGPFFLYLLKSKKHNFLD